MLNIDTDLDRQGVTRLVVNTSVPVVTETVTAAPVRQEAAAFIATPESDWEWRELRDYVVAEIERRFGAFPHVAVKEAGIFKSFLERWGDKAVAISHYAFEINDGMWRGAPISITRFCRNSDPWFAEVIAERLATLNS